MHVAVGGDLDGDHVLICFWKKLVALVKLTQPSVSRLEPVLKLCDLEILEAIIFNATAWTDAGAHQRGQRVIIFSF